MTGAEVIAAARAAGLALTVTEVGTIRCRPTPSPEWLAELRDRKLELLELLAPASAQTHSADLARHAVRIEYTDDGQAVGFWIVPDHFPDATLHDEPALRRSDVAALLDCADGALGRAVAALRAFPGSRVCGIDGVAAVGQRGMAGDQP